jgi:hypothetical protein
MVSCCSRGASSFDSFQTVALGRCGLEREDGQAKQAKIKLMGPVEGGMMLVMMHHRSIEDFDVFAGELTDQRKIKKGEALWIVDCGLWIVDWGKKGCKPIRGWGRMFWPASAWMDVGLDAERMVGETVASAPKPGGSREGFNLCG